MEGELNGPNRGEGPCPVELADELSDKSLAVLRTIDIGFGGEANTNDLTRALDVTNYHINYHVQPLLSEGAVERCGQEDVGAPQPANVYATTEFGERVVEAASETGPSLELLQSDVERQEQAIVAMRDRLDEQAETIEQQAAVNQRQEEKIDRMADYINRLHDYIDDIDARVGGSESLNDEV